MNVKELTATLRTAGIPMSGPLGVPNLVDRRLKEIGYILD